MVGVPTPECKVMIQGHFGAEFDVERFHLCTGDHAERQTDLALRGIVLGDADQVEFFTVGQDEPVSPIDPMSEGIRKIQLLVRSDVNPPVLVRRVIKNLRPTVEPLAEKR